MNNDPVLNQLRELSWRRKLTPVEETELRLRLVANTQAQAEWELEAALNALSGGVRRALITNLSGLEHGIGTVVSI